MNWRKPIIYGLLYLSKSNIPKYLKLIGTLAYKSPDEIKQIQEERLKEILLHAYRNVPYYHGILREVGVVNENGKVYLENFDKIPILTKDIIRIEGEELYSRDYKKRDWYKNSSGGSTGEPVQLIQDREYYEWNVTNKIYYNQMVGKDVGEGEIKLWGSERDIFKGTIGIKAKTINFLYNRQLLNSFKMTEKDMENYVNKINEFTPKSLLTYVDSIYELAKFIEINNLEISPPDSIIATAGTLVPEVRNYVEKIFRTKVYNQYGSREVGDIACECIERDGLHIFSHTHLVEILDNKENPIKNREGEFVVTLLTNYSMPLIRYRIGDTGLLSERLCACGRGLPLLESVTGRVTDHFITSDNSLVHGEYFTHLFYYKEGIKKFQVVQEDYNFVIVYIVLEKSVKVADFNSEIKDIESKIKLVMGKDCKVEFEFVDEISKSKSGKFLFTKSKVYKR